MKQITFIKRCNIKDKEYKIGDKLIPTNDDMPLIIKLNEKGFIKPLNFKELTCIQKELNKKCKKEEEF